MEQMENLSIIRREVTDIPEADAVIIAAGPLVSEALSKRIAALTGGFLSFYDAAAPIVTADSIDMQQAFVQSRYDRGGDDYINCPMNREEYERFYEALVCAEVAEIHTFDKRKGVYEGCMPIEVMAKRGADTIRFGPMKPVGLREGFLPDSRPGARRVCTVRRHAPQHLYPFAVAVTAELCADCPEQSLFCRADYRRGGVYGIRYVRYFGGSKCGAVS